LAKIDLIIEQFFMGKSFFGKVNSLFERLNFFPPKFFINTNKFKNTKEKFGGKNLLKTPINSKQIFKKN
jgi:hypothetical protein